MTKEMTAGREMDAMIMEKAFGKKTRVNVFMHKEHTEYLTGEKNSMGWDIWKEVPHYSTDIAAAWEVVEKIQQDFFINLICGRDDGRKNEKFGFNCSIGYYENMGEAEWWGDAETAPLAICRAALKTLGVNIYGDS